RSRSGRRSSKAGSPPTASRRRDTERRARSRATPQPPEKPRTAGSSWSSKGAPLLRSNRLSSVRRGRRAILFGEPDERESERDRGRDQDEPGAERRNERGDGAQHAEDDRRRKRRDPEGEPDERSLNEGGQDVSVDHGARDVGDVRLEPPFALLVQRYERHSP